MASNDDDIDFGYYFKNLRPKEIRNALNNFKNEVAENTRIFKEQCLKQHDILDSNIYFDQIIENGIQLKNHLKDIKSVVNHIQIESQEQHESSESSIQMSTSENLSTVVESHGIYNDLTT